jgi:RNA polymerase sigma-70 factor (ECF subfamily)
MSRDDEEFARVFDEVYPGLCRFLEYLLGGPAAAQDIAQESFLRLYRAGLDSVPYVEARFWLFRVARNLALNEIETRRRRSRLFDKVRDAFQFVRSDPEKQLEEAERARIALELLKQLPEHQRAALVLREQQEMSYSEIARVLNISESKVKVDIFRARALLREKYREAQAASTAR